MIAARVKRLEDEAREALLQYQFLENEKAEVNEQCQQLEKEVEQRKQAYKELQETDGFVDERNSYDRQLKQLREEHEKCSSELDTRVSNIAKIENVSAKIVEKKDARIQELTAELTKLRKDNERYLA